MIIIESVLADRPLLDNNCFQLSFSLNKRFSHLFISQILIFIELLYSFAFPARSPRRSVVIFYRVISRVQTSACDPADTVGDFSRFRTSRYFLAPHRTVHYVLRSFVRVAALAKTPNVCTVCT